MRNNFSFNVSYNLPDLLIFSVYGYDVLTHLLITPKIQQFSGHSSIGMHTYANMCSLHHPTIGFLILKLLQTLLLLFKTDNILIFKMSSISNIISSQDSSQNLLDKAWFDNHTPLSKGRLERVYTRFVIFKLVEPELNGVVNAFYLTSLKGNVLRNEIVKNVETAFSR